MIRKVYLTFLLLFITLLIHAQTEKSQWVDSVYSSLTMEQRLGQLFIFPANGYGNQDHKNSIFNTIDRYTLGGIIITSGAPKNVIELTNEVRSRSSLPMLSMIHIDGGLSTVLDNVNPLPSPLMLASSENRELASQSGKNTSNQLKLLGIDVGLGSGAAYSNFSTVYNSYGSNLSRALSIDSAFLAGFKNGGVYAGKSAFPTLQGKYNRKETDEKLALFNSAIKQGVKFLTINHTITSLDQKAPAVLSKNTFDYIEKNFDFSGFTIAENLEEIHKYKPGKTEAQALQVGNDLIVSSNISNSIKQIKRLLRKGDLSHSLIEEKVRKLLALKYEFDKKNGAQKSTDNIEFKINNPCATTNYNKALEQSLTYLPGESNVPINVLEEKSFASLNIGNNPYFQSFLNNYTNFSHYNTSFSIEKLKNTLPLFDHIIISLFDETISDNWIELVNSFDPKKVIVCSTIRQELKMLNPDITIIAGHTNDVLIGKYYPQAIFGAFGTTGKLAISLDNRLSDGMGKNSKPSYRYSFTSPEQAHVDGLTLAKIDEIATEAVKSKATPGCQILVARKGSVIYHKSFGYHTYDSLKRVDNQSIYDIASITKVAATTQAIMFLEERQIIDLDKKMAVYLPDLKGTNKENMTIRDILTHQAGLWPFLPFWKETVSDESFSSIYYSNHPDDDFPYQLSEGMYISNITRDSVWNWVKASKLRSKGALETFDYKYSDMGYYMMQRLIEKVVNQPLEEFLQQNFYDPLGLSTLSFLPLCKYPQNLIAPTENDNYFRKTLVKGMVHDQGAAMMGGVAGHAGLFSNALDLAKLMQMNLQDGYYGGHRYFMEGTLERFTSIQYESNRRGIGWDKPVVAEWNSPTSVFASPKSFGHTGFTGTAVWVDPEFDLVYVFLSNRIYPDVNNVKLIKNNIRTRIQDLIYQAIWKYEESPDARCN